MTGRHAMTREAALNSVNTPAGRGLLAAMAVGTAFGITMPAANAAENTSDLNQAVLTAKSDEAAKAAEDTSTNAVTTADDVEWGTSEDLAVNGGENQNDPVRFEADVDVAEPVVQEEPAAEQTAADSTAAATTTESEAATENTATSVSYNAGSSSSIVNTAMSYVGAPYVWGGTTPSGWDCIGFVRYVFAQNGVSIGGYTSSVLSVGTVVPYSQAQPGDILYWPGHVAISLGNGQNVGAWNESMGTAVGPDSYVGGTPTVIRVF